GGGTRQWPAGQGARRPRDSDDSDPRRSARARTRLRERGARRTRGLDPSALQPRPDEGVARSDTRRTPPRDLTRQASGHRRCRDGAAGGLATAAGLDADRWADILEWTLTSYCSRHGQPDDPDDFVDA